MVLSGQGRIAFPSDPSTRYRSLCYTHRGLTTGSFELMEPMSIEQALAGSDTLSQVKATDEAVYWLATIAEEDGRTTIRRLQGEQIEDLTPTASIRSRVMEYGGGAYDVADDLVAYCDDYLKLIMVLEDGQARPVTQAQPRFRFGGLHLDPAHRQLIAVREDHDAPGEPRTQIVALDLDSANEDGGRVLVTGADFYAGPRVHGDHLAWFQWDHPNMSWDTASVWRAPLADPGAAVAAASAADVSAMHPLWAPDGSLLWCDDSPGHWSWHDGATTMAPGHDCAIPVWVLDDPVAAITSDGRLATIEIVDGFGRLAIWDRGTGDVTHPLAGTAMIDSIATQGDSVVVIAEWPHRPATLERISADGGSEVLLDAEPVSGAVIAQPVTAEGPEGEVHAFFYPVPGLETPPLLVMTHGGPTSATSASYDRTRQFWLSRGVAVLDVNYSGSTGFGREYRERLKGSWGVLDVADVVASVTRVTGDRLADAERVVITGGSAGGYTTLQALVTSDVFAAGMSRYGIADLRALATDTHKAESRYLDGLIGPYPEDEELYLERSPISRLEHLSTPMLILQGTEDAVVPPNQAEMMADAVRAKDLPVALVMFDGEGHGFRAMTARRRALEAQVSFLQQVLGLEHSDDIPELAIENL